MAEETPTHSNIEFMSHDDVAVMRELLHAVKGLSPVSMSPALVLATDDDADEGIEFAA